MAERYLTILEISGKQSYIFSSNKLKDNVERSEEIAWITSSEGIAELTKGSGTYREADNYVYAGGGHTILEFRDLESAKAFAGVYSLNVHKDFPEADLFIKTIAYDSNKKPGDNLNELTEKLEKKKSIRRSSFHQGSFGIEKINSTTLNPERVPTAEQERLDQIIRRKEYKVTASLMPKQENDQSGYRYRPTYQFENLGGSKGDSNFIAVVHIDGNGMGKRVADFYKSRNHLNWDEFKKAIRAFSEGIQEDFEEAFREMNEKVADALQDGRLKDLSLDYADSDADEIEREASAEDTKTQKNRNFPVRRVISSGDDICFVSEGRIGIECAKAFVEALTRKRNEADGKGYSACAGVAIVHSKYPFFRAYDLAEGLCSSAKRYGAAIHPEDNGQSISSIDWHIEQGEIGDSLEDIRAQYIADDGTRLNLRPYILAAPEDVLEKNSCRRFPAFRKVLDVLSGTPDDNARSSMKEMRSSLLRGEKETNYYIQFHKLDPVVRRCYIGNFVKRENLAVGVGKAQNASAYVKTDEAEGTIKRSILYDAIEVMDTYLPLEKEA